MDIIERLYLNDAVRYHGLLLFRQKAALSIVDSCREYGKKILGIDAFRVFSYGIQPFMEYSTDYSALETEITWCKAKSHLENCCADNLVFEIVIQWI